MNVALEIHDSTIDEIKREGAFVTLVLDKSIIHRSEKEPGVDEGTCWIQPIEITFEDARILSKPSDIPNQLDYGYFTINGEKFTNVIEIPLNETGQIEALFETIYGNELRINAKKIVITEVGEAEYLQEF